MGPVRKTGLDSVRSQRSCNHVVCQEGSSRVCVGPFFCRAWTLNAHFTEQNAAGILNF
jgi:hypothetical protein